MFVHLHLHTEYSLVDSVVRIQSEGEGVPGLMDAVAAAGMPAVALTDQSNLFAMVKFYKAAQAAGVKPIIGVDLRVREPASAPSPRRWCCCVRTTIGYDNLTRLVSRSYLEGQQQGRRDRSIAAGSPPTTSTGLIALSGAREGDVGRAHPQRPRRRRAQRARFLARAVRRSLLPRAAAHGPRGRGALHAAARCELAIERGVPVVATNDVRFIRARGLRIARSARLHPRRRAARRSEAPPPLQRSSST